MKSVAGGGCSDAPEEPVLPLAARRSAVALPTASGGVVVSEARIGLDPGGGLVMMPADCREKAPDSLN